MCRIGEISNAGLQNFIKNDDKSEIKIPHISVWNLGGDEVIRARYTESRIPWGNNNKQNHGEDWQSAENLGGANNL